MLDHIEREGKDSETLNIVYVVDEDGRLIDDIRIRKFLLTPKDRPVSDIMDFRYVSLSARQDQERAIKLFKETNRVALPVTDFDGLLLGIVTVDDLISVIEEEDTEDIQKLGALKPWMSHIFNFLYSR